MARGRNRTRARQPERGERPAGAPATARPVTRWPRVAGLFIVTAAAFLGTLRCGFVNFDDNVYVTEAESVRGGLRWESAVAAFASYQAGNWHPLTTLSLALDATVAGLEPRWFHLHNVLLHALAAVLLALALERMTGRHWPSLAAAALWAVHPLRVESVAWISARKDVLSGVLFMVVLLAWERYARSPGRLRMAYVTLALAAGLMAKPTLVVAPALLLVLDYWPLARGHGEGRIPRLVALIVEKWPLWLLAAAASLATLAAQAGSKAVAGIDALPLSARLANAPVATARYLGKLLLPERLAVLYPLRFETTAAVIAAVVLLGAITAAVWWARRRLPWLAAGWAWFLIGLVPVIGVVQVGTQAIADRYTYLPQIGLFVAAAWSGAALAERHHRSRPAFVTACVGLVLVLGALTHRQVAVWRDSVTLWRRAIACTTDNVTAHVNLGKALMAMGQQREGVDHLQQALAIDATNPDAATDLGVQAYLAGDFQAARDLFLTARQRRPDDPVMLTNLGLVLAAQGEWRAAAESFAASLQLRPEGLDALIGLGAAKIELGRPAEAVATLRRAAAAGPRGPLPWYHLGRALAAQGACSEAAAAWRRALALDPAHALSARALASHAATGASPGCTPGAGGSGGT